MSQSNTRVGDIRVRAGESLVGMEGRLVKMAHDGGAPVVVLPEVAADLAVYLVIEGGAEAALVSVRPVQPDRNVRVSLKGSCNPGDVLVLANPASPDTGKLRALPTDGGTYRGLGIAEEAGVDGQLVLVRPAMVGEITVAAV